MRKLMRGIAHPAATYIAVWEECYWRWRSLCEFVVKSPLDPILSQDTYANRDDQLVTPEVSANHLTSALNSWITGKNATVEESHSFLGRFRWNLCSG